MYCSRCGKFNADDKDVCAYCGGILTYNRVIVNNSKSKDKYTIGFLLSFFTGLIGLIIGCFCLYPAGTEERDSFLDGWVAGFVISIIAILVIMVCGTCIMVA